MSGGHAVCERRAGRRSRWPRQSRFALFALLTLAAGGCATTGTPPSTAPAQRAPELLLHLSPASLGKTFALHQHLRLEARGEVHEFEALLEVDQREVRLALLFLGQPAARLTWDGSKLREEGAAGWPKFVSGERILTDLMLVYWPPAAIAADLPADWELKTQDDLRELRWQGRLIAGVRVDGPSAIVLDNWSDDYHIRIESVALHDQGGARARKDGGTFTVIRGRE